MIIIRMLLGANLAVLLALAAGIYWLSGRVQRLLSHAEMLLELGRRLQPVAPVPRTIRPSPVPRPVDGPATTPTGVAVDRWHEEVGQDLADALLLLDEPHGKHRPAGE